MVIHLSLYTEKNITLTPSFVRRQWSISESINESFTKTIRRMPSWHIWTATFGSHGDDGRGERPTKYPQNMSSAVVVERHPERLKMIHSSVCAFVVRRKSSSGAPRRRQDSGITSGRMTLRLSCAGGTLSPSIGWSGSSGIETQGGGHYESGGVQSFGHRSIFFMKRIAGVRGGMKRNGAEG